ncbi:alpha/beta hydrolase family protein [Wenjunlia tyrosinilytica]|uniref:Lipase n=1 Tax=Wenjunlia tyrosinilytica TaxID=1544741 RepID=A0A918DWI9_9ACTN|nr:alpha/beta hydrolase [Wenjunlia tyrosinilytica]GGO85005.1 lipase [Wenjunlia tyrosinilytica]
MTTAGAGAGAGAGAQAEADRVLGLADCAPDGTLRYGSHPDQVIDLWWPRGLDGEGSGLPFVVLVHGGFWREAYDRRHISPLAAHLARRGHRVASVEYRRVGGAGGHSTTLEDVERALEAVRRTQAAQFRVVGHSAGGHLALWAASRPDSGITKVVALAPVADLARADELGLGGGAVLDLFGGDLSDIALADPVALLPTGVPTTLIHGRDDPDVPIELSERFVAAARSAGDEPRLIALEGTGHFAVVEPGSDACDILLRELREPQEPREP